MSRVSITGVSEFLGSFSELPSSNSVTENCLDRKKNTETMEFSNWLFISDKIKTFWQNLCLNPEINYTVEDDISQIPQFHDSFPSSVESYRYENDGLS